jgi:hypothetical protein
MNNLVEAQTEDSTTITMSGLTGEQPTGHTHSTNDATDGETTLPSIGLAGSSITTAKENTDAIITPKENVDTTTPAKQNEDTTSTTTTTTTTTTANESTGKTATATTATTPTMATTTSKGPAIGMFRQTILVQCLFAFTITFYFII